MIFAIDRIHLIIAMSASVMIGMQPDRGVLDIDRHIVFGLISTGCHCRAPAGLFRDSHS